MILKIPFYKQDTGYTCGPVSLQMVLSFLGVFKSEKYFSKTAHSDAKDGTRHKNMIDIARTEGFFCYVNEGSSVEELRYFLSRELPPIVHYSESVNNEGHYAVVVGITRNEIILNDPWFGKHFSVKKSTFLDRWLGTLDGHVYKRWMMVISPTDLNLGKQYQPLK